MQNSYVTKLGDGVKVCARRPLPVLRVAHYDSSDIVHGGEEPPVRRKSYAAHERSETAHTGNSLKALVYIKNHHTLVNDTNSKPPVVWAEHSVVCLPAPSAHTNKERANSYQFAVAVDRVGRPRTRRRLLPGNNNVAIVASKHYTAAVARPRGGIDGRRVRERVHGAASENFRHDGGVVSRCCSEEAAIRAKRQAVNIVLVLLLKAIQSFKLRRAVTVHLRRSGGGRWCR